MPAPNDSSQLRSPFVIIEELISPMLCEDIIGELDFDSEGIQRDHEGTITPNRKINPLSEQFLIDHLGAYTEAIGRHYDCTVDDHESCVFERYPTGWTSPGATPALYRKGPNGWFKTGIGDFVATLFLMDHHDGVAGLDPYREVYGGKLEFPSFKFGFTPNAGTMIIHPVAPNFASTFAPVYAGELNVVQILLTTATPYRCNMANFGPVPMPHL